MNLILFDNEIRDQLLPLTYTRPVCELRVGILTIREKWEKWMGGKISFITQDYLAEKYQIDYGDDNFVVNGSVLPSPQLCTLMKQMNFNEAYLQGDELIVARLDEDQFERLIHDEDITEIKGFDIEDTEYLKINHLWDLFQVNAAAIEADFDLLTKGRTSQPINSTNQVLGPENVFVEPGAVLNCTTLNATKGPIYIGANAEIMEGAMIRGPFAICNHGVIKMGAKIYGGTTLGPYVKAGGEINNSIIQGYSNKGHDGYLGNSFVGEWCNIGADTNTSNLKNNYGKIKLWNYLEKALVKTDLQFCGLFMGDHSKCGINTMFNTGTIVGVGASIFGGGFPQKFVPSYSWGGSEGITDAMTDKTFETIERMKARRNEPFNVEDRIILLRVHEESAKFRTWN